MEIALVADIETDGLIDELTAIHCLGVKDVRSGESHLYVGADIPTGLLRLQGARRVIFHNGIDFDIEAIKKVYPWFTIPEACVVDTLVMSRVMYPDQWDSDKKLVKTKGFPARLSNRHSLEAWGYRLGLHKGDYQGDPNIADEKERKLRKWESYNEAMGEYCLLDLEVTAKLYQLFLSKNYSQECLDLEHAVRWIIARQERHGFAFDTQAAAKLYSTLTAEKLKLESELKSVFTPRYLRDGKIQTPKRDLKNRGYMEGAPFTKVVLTEFSASNRNHIVYWLKQMYGWEPREFGDDGKPKMDESVLAGLKYPEVDQLRKYLTVDKRISQLATGTEAWLKHEKNGRMHGSVNSNGAVTGRMTHAKPNIGQVPAVYSLYGKECRSLFVASKGKVLVGADASSLELRDLAGFMSRFDEGAYASTVLSDDKANGLDIHSVNCKALGMPDPKAKVLDNQTGRDIAKTWFYAFIYGAGDEKLGIIRTGKRGESAKAVGKSTKASFMKNLPALKKLIEKVQEVVWGCPEKKVNGKVVKKAVKGRGHLIGLDGRILHVRSKHSVLNTLLQSAGAIQMKKALVLLDNSLKDLGYIPGTHYEFVANVHDEWQIEVDEDKAETVGQKAVEAIRQSGIHFNFRCPLDGEYKVGPNWAATH